MRIAISAMFLASPSVGSGQYLRGLLAGLARAAPGLRVTLLAPAGAAADSPHPAAESVAVPTPFDGRSENLAKLWFEQVGAPLAARRAGADVLHVPYFAPPLRSPIPVVASVLDLIPMLLPEYRGGPHVRLYTRLAAAGARRAARLIAISEAGRRDIVRHLGVPERRVTVTHLAAGAQYQPPRDRAAARAEVAARYGIESDYVYYVGGLDARKNVATLVRGFAAMRRGGGPDVALVIAGRALGGSPRLFPDIDAVVAAEGAGAWVRRIEVPAADGPLLYGAAALFAAPSRYEGFGLGPLEAMACGTPVVAADSSSTPEVVGDAALLVGPDDVAGWAAALRRALEDRELAEDLQSRGLARAARFSYDATAAATAAVYAAALAGRGG